MTQRRSLLPKLILLLLLSCTACSRLAQTTESESNILDIPEYYYADSVDISEQDLFQLFLDFATAPYRFAVLSDVKAATISEDGKQIKENLTKIMRDKGWQVEKAWRVAEVADVEIEEEKDVVPVQ